MSSFFRKIKLPFLCKISAQNYLFYFSYDIILNYEGNNHKKERRIYR